MRYILLSILAFTPGIIFAQGLQSYIPSFIAFINRPLIPFLLGIAFLVLVFNVVRYFVVASTSEEGRETAKAYILYSIFAFVFIIIFWGIINLLVSTTGLGGRTVPTPDFPGYSTSGAGNNNVGGNGSGTNNPPASSPSPCPPPIDPSIPGAPCNN